MAWRVARSLDVLLGQINAAFPGRNKASDGAVGDAAHATRASDHNPWYGPGIVTARDYTHDPAHGVDIDRLSDELAASRDSRIKYIIANRLILDSRPGNSPWRWVRYTGSNPHTKHLHLSVMDNASCDDTRSWNLPMLGGSHSAPSAPTPSAPGGIEDMALDTRFTDSFGNTQTVQSFMTEVMRKLNDLHYPAVSPGSVASRIPGDRNTTTVFDMIKDSTSWTNQTLGRVIGLQAAGSTDPNAVAEALRPVVADVIGPVVEESVTAALGADNQAQADAIVSEISNRLAEGSHDG